MTDTAEDSGTSSPTAITSQIEREREEIENAPAVPLRQLQPRSAGRCSFCGRPARTLTLVDNMHGMERYKGECCGGNSR